MLAYPGSSSDITGCVLPARQAVSSLSTTCPGDVGLHAFAAQAGIPRACILFGGGRLCSSSFRVRPAATSQRVLRWTAARRSSAWATAGRSGPWTAGR